MTSAQTKATTRMVVASFAAGVGAMVLLGVVAPVAMKGGLSVRDAFAAEVDERASMIEPLDVEAIEAQLAEADRLMAAMLETTADEMVQLERLAR